MLKSMIHTWKCRMFLPIVDNTQSHITGMALNKKSVKDYFA